jgi:hypothetical protein
VDVLLGRAVDVRAVAAVPGVVARAERDRVAGRADRDRPGVHEHPLDHAGTVRAAEVIGPGGQEQVEDLDQAAPLDPVEQPQVELTAGGGSAHPRALLGPDDHHSGLAPVFQQVTEGHAEPQGQRPQRLDGRIAPALLQVRQRGLGHIRAGREGSQGHPAGGAEPTQVRGDDVPDVGEGLV